MKRPQAQNSNVPRSQNTFAWWTEVQQWNYTDSLHSYGSAEYSVKQPSQLGHDRTPVETITLSADARERMIHAPSILAAMCTQIYGELKSVASNKLKLDLYATINQLPSNALPGTHSLVSKNHNLKVPYKDNNGNTYIIEFFDKRAEKNAIKRTVGPVVNYNKNELNYDWINTNILQQKNCLACHQAGSQHDFSSYEKLLQVINLKDPQKSHLLGMITSEMHASLPHAHRRTRNATGPSPMDQNGRPQIYSPANPQ